VPSIAIVLAAAMALILPGPAAASTRHDRWRRPLDGATVIRTFSFDPAAPYVRGRRRGIDLRDRPGAPVLAACSGTVTHAGRVPRWGPGVTLRCGGLVATELGLGSVAVARGAPVLAGSALGRLGARGVLRLGARRASGRQAYVDPLALLGGGESSPPVVAPPPPRRPGRRAPGPPKPLVRPAPVPAATSAPTRLPWPIWAGLGLLAVGAGGGTAARWQRSARPAPGTALAHRYR
jgi:murein DD-endopeptidase MepM/ murein hydrolase activator NlpD